MRNGLSLVAAFVATFTVSSLAAGCRGEKAPAEIRIGVVVPLTGGAAEFGKWARNGVELAIADLNREATPRGRLVAIYEDNQMDPKVGLSAFTKLVEIDRVLGVISAGSGVVLAIAPEAERTHTIQINHTAVNPAVCRAGHYTFTLVNDADVETDAIAQLAYQKLGIKRLAVLYANTSYGAGTRDAIVRSFTQVGGEVIGTVAFPEDFTDARAQLLELKEMSPPAVYFVATIKDSGRLLKQAAELDLRTQWLTYNAFESPEVLKIAGAVADGVIYTSSNLFDLPDPGTTASEFLKSYTARFGDRPNLYAATAYDAVHLLALAQATSGSSKESIQHYLASVAGYEGASGVITFGSGGCVRKPVFLKIVRDGKFTIYAVQPVGDTRAAGG